MRFQPPPGYQPFYNPVLPCSMPIYDALKVGMSLYCQGRVHDDATRFTLNLMHGNAGKPDYALHFNPRFDPYKVMVMNYSLSRKWGVEERPSEMPFSQGEDFELLIIVTSEGYQIKVNGSDLHLFRHRMLLEQVDTLSMFGDATVHAIDVIGGRIGCLQGYPGLGHMMSIPYAGPIFGGLKEGMSVHIMGSVLSDATRFHISLQSAEAKCSDKALHINPRFNPAELVVFNTFQNTIFDEQERVTDMPFTRGADFELVIHVTAEGYQVNVNGSEFHLFKHRLPLERVLALGIGGDVNVKFINITGGRDGAILAWPGPGYVGANKYTKSIQGGLKTGMSLYFRGTIPTNDVDGFSINLEGGGDIALHIYPRFTNPGMVVFNSKKDNEWQKEENIEDFPFRNGAIFELVFLVTSEGYEVSVDGHQIHLHKHCVPLEQVTEITIQQDVSVQDICIIRDGTRRPKSIRLVSDEQDCIQEITPTGDEEGEEGRIVKIPGPGDVSDNLFSHTIEGGLEPGMSLYFEGTVHSQSNRFDIDLDGGTHVVMHLKANFAGDDYLRFNTKWSGGWDKEEGPSVTPFRTGEDFQMVYKVTSEGYEVIVDGKLCYTYAHHVPVNTVTTLVIRGDVSIHAISIAKEQDCIQEITPTGDEEGEKGSIVEIPGPGDVSDNLFSHTIEGGVQKGMKMCFKGKVHSEVNRFHINLEGGGYIAMHLKAEFAGKDYLCFNTKWPGGWDKEERASVMPFRAGQDFEILFDMTFRGYKVFVDGKLCYTYIHRVWMDTVTTLVIGGDVSIHAISITKEAAFSQTIDGGLQPGTALYIQGKVHDEIDRFDVNLVGGGHIIFHFKVNFIGVDYLGLNTKTARGWGREEQFVPMPFRKGEEFDLLINVTTKGYQAIVNGKMYRTYKHRIPVDQVTSLTFDGDVYVKTINIIRDSMDCDGVGLTGFNWRFLPVMGTQPVFKPSVPAFKMIPGGLSLRKTIIVRGRVPATAGRSNIDLIVSSTGDRALHISLRPEEDVVVRNSLLRGTWGEEDRDLRYNPIQPGQYFEMMIRCARQKFTVFANGKHLFDYYHRFQPFTKIDCLWINGDVQPFFILV